MKRPSLICGLIALFLAGPFFLFSDPQIIHARGDSYYPPFEFLDENGKPAGFNVDLFRAVADVMGLQAEIDLGPWEEVRSQLENGQIDLLLGMFYSTNRDRLVDFSIPHTVISHAIFTRRDSTIRGPEDLHGKDILVQEGDIVHDYLLENHIAGQLIPVVNQREALQLLNRGYYDAAFVSKLQGLYFIQHLKLRNLKTVKASLIPRRYCFAVKEGDQELVSLLNEGLNIIKLNGTYEKIRERWLGVLEERDSFLRIRRLVLIGTAAAVAVILFLLIWSWSLKLTVDRRTWHLDEEIKRRKRVEKNLLESNIRLESSLKEKNVLLAEVHHRVKNNLQIINSLLQLQGNNLQDENIRSILRTSQNRIRSMSLLHEQLYSADDFSSINLREYISDLIDSVASAYQSGQRRIIIQRQLEGVVIDIGRAIPLGLILSEVITNSFQHAFPGSRNGIIEVRTRRGEDSMLELQLSDNGIGGLPVDSDKGSLGIQLIESLAEQLNGSLEVSSSSEGTCYTIQIPLEET